MKYIAHPYIFQFQFSMFEFSCLLLISRHNGPENVLLYKYQVICYISCTWEWLEEKSSSLDDRLVSSSDSNISLGVAAVSSSKQLDPKLLAPCKVAVVQSEHPEVVDMAEILLGSTTTNMSSTDLADLGLCCRCIGDSRHLEL